MHNKTFTHNHVSVKLTKNTIVNTDPRAYSSFQIKMVGKFLPGTSATSKCQRILVALGFTANERVTCVRHARIVNISPVFTITTEQTVVVTKERTCLTPFIWNVMMEMLTRAMIIYNPYSQTP